MVFHPQGHHDHAESVDKLLLLLRKRIQRHDTAADLDECISIGRSALAFCEPGNPGCATYLHDFVTDLHNRFRKLENISDIQEAHPDYAVSLHKLLVYVKDLIDVRDVAPVVDGIVAIARAALKLCPTGRPDHVMSLTTLAAFLRHRFQQQGVVADLDEALVLCQEAVEVCPSGSVALHELAWCLSERFTKLTTWADLDDAIKYEQAALALRPLGHPDHAESLSSLANSRQLRIKERSAIPQPNCPPVPTHGPSIEQLIRGVVLEILKAFPPRLLDTHNGTLCDRDSDLAFRKQPGIQTTSLVSLHTRHPPPNNSYPCSHIYLFPICYAVSSVGKIRTTVA